MRRRLTRFAWGGFAVLAVGCAMLLLSSTPAAAADDDPERPRGLLGSVTTLATTALTPVVATVAPVVDTLAPVTTAVTGTASAAVTPVVQTAADVVGAVVDTTTDAAASAPVVGPAAGAAVRVVGGAASDTVRHAASAVSGVLHDAPVTTLTRPVLDVVRTVPVVGHVVNGSGASVLVDSVVGVVDGAVSDSGTILDDVTPPVVNAVDPRPVAPDDASAPGDPQTPGGSMTDPGESPEPFLPGVPLPADDVDSGEDTPVLRIAGARAPRVPGVFSASQPSVSPQGGPSAGASPPGGQGSFPPSHAPPAPVSSSSAQASGGSFHDGARVPGVPAHALEFSVRTPHPGGDPLPPVPVSDTDVSPD